MTYIVKFTCCDCKKSSSQELKIGDWSYRDLSDKCPYCGNDSLCAYSEIFSSSEKDGGRTLYQRFKDMYLAFNILQMNKKKSYTISENTKSGKFSLGFCFDTPEEAARYAIEHFKSNSFILREFESEDIFIAGILLLKKPTGRKFLTRSRIIKALEEEDSE